MFYGNFQTFLLLMFQSLFFQFFVCLHMRMIFLDFFSMLSNTFSCVLCSLLCKSRESLLTIMIFSLSFSVPSLVVAVLFSFYRSPLFIHCFLSIVRKSTYNEICLVVGVVCSKHHIYCFFDNTVSLCCSVQCIGVSFRLI